MYLRGNLTKTIAIWGQFKYTTSRAFSREFTGFKIQMTLGSL